LEIGRLLGCTEMSANEQRRDDTLETAQADKVSAMLVNVYGLKLPNEMFSAAARSSNELAQILQNYADAIEQAKR
jgi:hypothetical protein